MGTRCTVQFTRKDCVKTIYQSMDGNVKYLVPFLQKFLKWNGNRCSNVQYTAANYVFYCKFDAMREHVKYWRESDPEKPQSLEEYFECADDNMGVTHTGYGITDNTHNDEQYFYVVDLDAMFIRVDEKSFGVFEELSQEFDE